jgi:peptide/nickel transport system substrate-binding protein
MQEWSLIFNTLVDVAADSQTVTPGLADTWTASPDATMFTFHLHPGIKWSDGTPFTAQDVVFSATWGAQNFTAFKGYQPQWNLLEGATAALHTTNAVPGVTAPDANTVVFKLAAPNADFLVALADMANVILPEHILKTATAANIEKTDFALCKTVVGTGPYTLQSYTPDQQAVFAANPNYFMGAPHIQSIIYKLVSDPSLGTAQLQSGALDIGFRLATNEYDTLKADSALNVVLAPNPGILAIDFLTLDPLVADPRVRQAFYYAINRQAIVTNYYQGRAKVLIGPPGFKQYPDLNTYAYNPAMAKQLLTAANYDFSKPFRLLYNNTFPDVPQIAPLIQQDLQAVGVNVQLEGLDNAATNADLLAQTGYDGTIAVGGSEGLRPSLTETYFTSAANGGAKLGTQYTNPDIFTLFAQGEASSDPATRDIAYDKLAKIFNTDLPIMYLLSPSLIDAVSKKVGGGFQIHLNDRETMMNVQTWTLAQ